MLYAWMRAWKKVTRERGPDRGGRQKLYTPQWGRPNDQGPAHCCDGAAAIGSKTKENSEMAPQSEEENRRSKKTMSRRVSQISAVAKHRSHAPRRVNRLTQNAQNAQCGKSCKDVDMTGHKRPCRTATKCLLDRTVGSIHRPTSFLCARSSASLSASLCQPK